jgi:hypothetical protein
MEEYNKSLLNARPTSAGAFSGGQIPLGFDASAIYQYSQGIPNPGAAPVVLVPQETLIQQEVPTSQAVREAYKESVYPEGWNRPIAPVEIVFPPGFDPNKPSHIAARNRAYDEAHDPGFGAVAALEMLGSIESQQAKIISSKKRVSELQGQLAQLENIKKNRPPTESWSDLGTEYTPMSPKQFYQNEVKIRDTKQALSKAESDLNDALQPVAPKPVNVVLPAEQPQQPAQPASQQPAQQENLPSAKEEVEGITDYPQDKWHRDNMAQIYNWARQAYATPGVKHADVDAQVKMLENNVNSQWVPEVRYLGGKMWRYDAPGKAVEVADKAGMVRDIFGNHVREASKMISGTQQLDKMIDLAKEAADPKTPKARKNEIIYSLQNSFKAITTAISGTSDAIQQQEFLRANAPLDALNVFNALVNPTSTSKFLESNPEAFAKGIIGVRDIASSRALQQYNDAEKIHKQFPDVYSKSALPTLPEYMQRMKNTSSGSIIEKNRPQQPQAVTGTTKGGTTFQFKR